MDKRCVSMTNYYTCMTGFSSMKHTPKIHDLLSCPTFGTVTGEYIPVSSFEYAFAGGVVKDYSSSGNRLEIDSKETIEFPDAIFTDEPFIAIREGMIGRACPRFMNEGLKQMEGNNTVSSRCSSVFTGRNIR